MCDSKLYTNSVKRVFDIAIDVSSVIVLSPVFVLIGFFVQMKIGSPVLFRQTRPGLHGEHFIIYKFRTMTDKLVKTGLYCRIASD